MKAAVCRTFGETLTIEDVDLSMPGPGEVSVRLGACAICHSDILYADGAWGGTLPAVYGHEAAGIVDTVGDGVAHLRRGDRAVVTLVRSCGRCGCCAQGFPGSCESRFPLDSRVALRASEDGSQLVQGLRTAAFAEQVLVDASQAVAIDPDVPFTSAALLACGVITGFGAVTNTARVRTGSTVVVIGVGGVGLNSVQAAHLSGARRVIAMDLNDAKLEAALRFGATDAVNAGSDDARDQVLALTNGRGADYVFVTVGAKSAFDGAYGLLAKGGAAVLVGMASLDVRSEFDPLTLADSSQRILGSKMGSANIHRDIPALVELYRQGRLKLDELVSGTFPLEGINDAIAAVKRGDALRNVIVFD